MSYDPGVTAVVVNYRTSWDLDEFCRSFYGSEQMTPTKLIIANVSPTPSDNETSLHWQKEFGAQGISYAENVGYALPCNEGATLGNHEVIALFNADVILQSNTISRCHEALMNNDSWGVLGPLQYDQRGRIVHAGIFGTHQQPKHRDWHLPVNASHRDVRPAVTVSGSAYFIKRQAWDELTACPGFQDVAPGCVGAFLPTPLFYEETFCSYQAAFHGWEVMYYGLAECVHKWHQAVDHNLAHNYANKCFVQSREIFRNACDHHGIPHD